MIKPLKQINKDLYQDIGKETLETEKETLKESVQNEYKKLQEIKEKKEALLQETKQLIENEKENWEKEKQTYINQAKDDGYSTGFALGKDEVLKQYNHLLKEANQIIAKATDDFHAKLDASDKEILNLAMKASEKIIKQKLNDDPAIMLSIVKAAINEIKDQSKIAIYVHPEKYEMVSNHKSELINLAEQNHNVSIYVNNDLKQDGCIIEHPFGQVDASIDTQLDQLKTSLHEVLMEQKQ